jgi:glycosyltransferase involved in cell wall biosynthesis
MKLSACLITLNEEANLGRALQSLVGLADEIVVVDSGSTDATEAIARQFGARWQVQPWLGYVGQKNLALQLASHEWVFSIDADEALSEPLRAELAAWKAGPAEPGISGYSMPRCTWYDGRWIRHGDWYPDRLVRLFRKDAAQFAGGRVHERLEITGGIRRWQGDLHHYSFRDSADHRARGEKYARLWAESAFERGKRAGPLAPAGHAAFRWLRGYLLRAGFLDGAAGWRIAAISARETALKYRTLREWHRRGSAPIPPR